MRGLFSGIYGLFRGMYGTDVFLYLKYGTTGEGDHGCDFIPIGIITLAVSLILGVLFYYIVNRPTWNNLKMWGAFALVNAIIGFLVGFLWVNGIINENPTPIYHMEDGYEVPATVGHALGFGFANFLVAAIFFFLVAMVLKWKSSNCANAPF